MVVEGLLVVEMEHYFVDFDSYFIISLCKICGYYFIINLKEFEESHKPIRA